LLYNPHPKFRSSTIWFTGASPTSNFCGWDDSHHLSSDRSISGAVASARLELQLIVGFENVVFWSHEV
ncbi:hypothetical protein LINPERHAP1_LOCUS8100, partial [Linum perenne]